MYTRKEKAKVDYFADLTRCFLLNDMEAALYYKLARFVNMCTPEELNYIKNFDYRRKSRIDVMVASLYQYGLFEQEKNGETYYVLSSFGTALKRDCLNFDEGVNGESYVLSYSQMKPLNITEPMTLDVIDGILET